MADSLNIQNNLDKEGCINVLEHYTHNDTINPYTRSACIQKFQLKIIKKLLVFELYILYSVERKQYSGKRYHF